MRNYLATAIFIVCFSKPIVAQQDESSTTEGVIIMSEANIVLLSKTLRKYKRPSVTTSELPATIATVSFARSDTDLESKFLQQQIALLEAQIKSNMVQQNKAVPVSKANNYDRRDYKDLKYELKRLQDQLERSRYENEDETTVINLTSSNAKPSVEDLPLQDNNQAAEFKILQRKMDSIQNTLNNEGKIEPVDHKDDFNMMQQKLADLQKELISKNKTPDDLADLRSKFGKFKRELFFDNNSKTLSKEGMVAVEELYAIMDTYSSLNVVVQGFASDKGSIDKNETISMLRTASVKKALMVRGIHANRILTQYHGIDYMAKTEAHARRVEISFLITKQ